ncbi:aldo/keto reductase [Paenibacillus qinlingensis]|uniref:aldo/keto reductase n=1 Tax=Paenibacillus qinlingensis TaxID=1837343 RepID=UPI0015636607|nr:aldo/keto reductase [Paenibacillus qinlingensis]NQX61039.1 aldo/keto reductase [Paenibacillus qinlingensis]
MKQLALGKSDLLTSEISLGCMRIAEMESSEVAQLIGAALDARINLFDHADIYGNGRSEEVFAKAVGMLPIAREDIVIQSKCGIRKGYYDFSKDYIVSSVEGILQRLHTDYLDVLILHRPDTLMEPEEVAEAFDQLYHSGKVRHFGVSNHNSMQIELLHRYLNQRLIVNQLQFGLAFSGMVDTGLNVNMNHDASINRDGSILEYCRVKEMTIQTWSSLQYGFFAGTFLNNDLYPELNKTLNRIAEVKSVTSAAVAIAWVLRHPARMQPVLGTTNAMRLTEMAKASEISLSKQEWYELYLAAGNKLP